jgi:hypothetical protein
MALGNGFLFQPGVERVRLSGVLAAWLASDYNDATVLSYFDTRDLDAGGGGALYGGGHVTLADVRFSVFAGRSSPLGSDGCLLARRGHFAVGGVWTEVNTPHLASQGLRHFSPCWGFPRNSVTSH